MLLSRAQVLETPLQDFEFHLQFDHKLRVLCFGSCEWVIFEQRILGSDRIFIVALMRKLANPDKNKFKVQLRVLVALFGAPAHCFFSNSLFLPYLSQLV